MSVRIALPQRTPPSGSNSIKSGTPLVPFAVRLGTGGKAEVVTFAFENAIPCRK